MIEIYISVVLRGIAGLLMYIALGIGEICSLLKRWDKDGGQ